MHLVVLVKHNQEIECLRSVGLVSTLHCDFEAWKYKQNTYQITESTYLPEQEDSEAYFLISKVLKTTPLKYPTNVAQKKINVLGNHLKICDTLQVLDNNLREYMYCFRAL